MSALDADAIARRVWPEAEPRVEALGGGITNHNFRVDVDGETFVLRIGGRAFAYSLEDH